MSRQRSSAGGMCCVFGAAGWTGRAIVAELLQHGPYSAQRDEFVRNQLTIMACMIGSSVIEPP